MLSKYVLGVAALVSGLAVPAMAANWDHIADITIRDNPDVQSQWVHFTGPVNGLEFRTSGAVDCAAIDVTSADGQTRNVFSGTMENSEHVVGLNALDNDVRSISFDCRALSGPTANISVAADMAAPPVIERRTTIEVDRQWRGLGHEWFRPVSENKRFFIGGRNVSEIDIEPTRADADCRHGMAILDNGDVRELDVDLVGRLHQNRMYHFVLDDQPNVREIELDCRAANGSIVSLNVYADQEILPYG